MQRGFWFEEQYPLVREDWFGSTCFENQLAYASFWVDVTTSEPGRIERWYDCWREHETKYYV